MMSDNNELEREDHDDPIDRGIPSVNRRKVLGGGAVQKFIIGVMGVLVVVSLIAVNGGFSSSNNYEDSKKRKSKAEIGNHLGPAPKLPDPPPLKAEKNDHKKEGVIRTGQNPPPRYPVANKKQKPTPRERKLESQLLAFGGKQGQSGKVYNQQNQPTPSRGNNGRGGFKLTSSGNEAVKADGLDAKLKSTNVEGAIASLIADPDMFITKGSILDCALKTAISSDVPGMTSCRITRDIYSTSGNVLLIEGGSIVTGRYSGGLKHGKARIFVLWTRIETPNHVIVNLDSPGADALGRSGHSGYIDTHFWERFSGAIMLSMIDDIGTYAANKSSKSSGDDIHFGSTTQAAQNAAGIALKNSINIPATLNKNQGDHISIFVARDLDFRGVYDLETE